MDRFRSPLSNGRLDAARQDAGRLALIDAFELPFVPSHRTSVTSPAVQDFAQLQPLETELRKVHPICSCTHDQGARDAEFHIELPGSSTPYTTTFVPAMNNARYDRLRPILKRYWARNAGQAAVAQAGRGRPLEMARAAG